MSLDLRDGLQEAEQIANVERDDVRQAFGFQEVDTTIDEQVLVGLVCGEVAQEELQGVPDDVHQQERGIAGGQG